MEEEIQENNELESQSVTNTEDLGSSQKTGLFLIVVLVVIILGLLAVLILHPTVVRDALFQADVAETDEQESMIEEDDPIESQKMTDKHSLLNTELMLAKGARVESESQGMVAFLSRGGLYQFEYPESWMIVEENTAVPGVEFLTDDYELHIFTDSRPEFSYLTIKSGARVKVSLWSKDAYSFVDGIGDRGTIVTLNDYEATYFDQSKRLAFVDPSDAWVVEFAFTSSRDDEEIYKDVLLKLGETFRFNE